MSSFTEMDDLEERIFRSPVKTAVKNLVPFFLSFRASPAHSSIHPIILCKNLDVVRFIIHIPRSSPPSVSEDDILLYFLSCCGDFTLPVLTAPYYSLHRPYLLDFAPFFATVPPKKAIHERAKRFTKKKQTSATTLPFCHPPPCLNSVPMVVPSPYLSISAPHSLYLRSLRVSPFFFISLARACLPSRSLSSLWLGKRLFGDSLAGILYRGFWCDSER